jgi:hypothetical protein
LPENRFHRGCEQGLFRISCQLNTIIDRWFGRHSWDQESDVF